MRRIALRGLLDHKGRLVSTLVAVVLGVAFVGGVLTLTDTMNKSFDDLFGSVYEGTDAVVRSDRTIDQFGTTERGSIDEALVETVQGVDGVAVAEPFVEGYARIIDADGDPVGNPSMGPPTLGGNWSDVDDLNPFALREGRPPAAEGEVVIDAASADATGFGVGDTVTIQTQDGVEPFTLVGVAGFGTADSPGGASYALWTLPESQRLVGEPGRIDSVSVVADPGLDEQQITDAVAAVVPGDAEVLTGAAITEETQSQIKDDLSFVTMFFMAFAVVAVFVGAFVIYNAFSIIVAQRTREMALLRAVGASRRQVRRAVVVESAAVGLVGSIVGFLLGLGLATLLGDLLSLPDGSLVVRRSSVATAIVLGVVVTVASALVPAWRAAKVPPVAAMRDVAVDTSHRSRRRRVAGLLAVAAGVASLAAAATSDEPATAGRGIGLVFVGLLLLGPTLARPVSRALGAPLARLRGTSGRLARNNAARNPRRTAATAQGLMVGVGIVAFFLVVNSSIRASIDQTLDESFHGDFVVDSGTFGMVGLPTSVADEIADQPTVDLVAPVRFTTADVEGEASMVVATDPGAFDLFELEVPAGSADLAPGEVVLDADEAASRGLTVGDRITADFLETGERTYTVAGLYRTAVESGIDLENYVIGLDEMEAAAPEVTDSQVFVKLVDGVSVADAEPGLEAVVEPYATAEVQSVEEYKDALGAQLDALLVLVVGLLLLAIVIALIGIANTVALSILERTREIGVLRAVGMSRRQLRTSIRWESAIISLLGTGLGLAIGVIGSWGLIRSLPADEGFSAYSVPLGMLVGIALIAGLLGMVAALLPAWRAGRLNVLDAIQAD